MLLSLARRQTVDAEIFTRPTKLPLAAPDSHHTDAIHRDSSRIHKNERNLFEPGTEENPEDINDKIRTMLAATEALKPGSSRLPENDAADSKKSRIVSSKVLKKISNAFSKLYPKNEGTVSMDDPGNDSLPADLE